MSNTTSNTSLFVTTEVRQEKKDDTKAVRYADAGMVGAELRHYAVAKSRRVFANKTMGDRRMARNADTVDYFEMEIEATDPAGAVVTKRVKFVLVGNKSNPGEPFVGRVKIDNQTRKYEISMLKSVPTLQHFEGENEYRLAYAVAIAKLHLANAKKSVVNLGKGEHNWTLI